MPTDLAPRARPLRVLFTADAVGGVFSYCVTLAKGLSANGVECAFAFMGKSLSDDQRRTLLQVPNVTVFESSFALEWMPDPWQDVDAAGDWLLGLEREFQPDLVHLNGYSHAALPWSVPTVVVAHSCVFSWWKAVYGTDPPPEFEEYRRRVRAGLEAANWVLAPTYSMLVSLRDHYAPTTRQSVMPNGAQPPAFGGSRRLPVYLAAGRFWDKAKNLEVLEEVASRLPWQLRLAGETGRADPLAGPIEFLGPLSASAFARELRGAAVFLHPALYEPFGLSVLEAAYSSCALILGDIPSLRELWGDSAVYVDPRNPESLRRACVELATNESRRHWLGERARRRAALYSLETMTRGYLRVYRELLTARSRPSGFVVRARAHEVTRVAGSK